ncbi:MAG: glycosyltransferase [Candidatus Kapabacteria bacterium]|nr:glycosyltransferase [Candidatus Kapabacteria bacterium]
MITHSSPAQQGLRILILCNRVTYPPNDGGSIGAYQVAKGFADEGNSVTMLAFNTRKHYVDIASLGDEFTKRITLHTMDVDSAVTPLGALKNLFSKQSYQVARFDVPAFRAMLHKHLAEHDYDVIHIEGIHMAVYLETLRKYSRAAVVLRAPNVEHQLWQTVADAEKNPLKKSYLRLQTARYKRFEIDTLKRIDALIAVTPDDREYFTTFLPPERCLLAPTGIEQDTYAPRHIERMPDSVFHLGDLGWMPNRQAVEWFIENVWQAVRREAPDLVFELVGRNIPTEYDTSYSIGDYGMRHIEGKNIAVLGDTNDAYGFMQSRNIMIVPIFSGGGMRVKIIEGLASGNVIVTTPLGVQGILARHNEHVLVASTAGEFAAAIIRIAREPGLAERLRTNAAMLIKEEYAAETINTRITQFYRRLVEQRESGKK